jgi:hypothetical protein
MAYAAVVTYSTRQVNGRRYVNVTVAETEAGPSSEYTIALVHNHWTLMNTRVVLGTGTGTTVQPEMGRSAAWLTTDATKHIAAQDTPAASINDPTVKALSLLTGELFVRSKVDSGADNVITTELELVEGWV